MGGGRRYDDRSLTMTSLPIWVSAVLLVVVLPVVTVGIQLALRRRYPSLREGDHDDVDPAPLERVLHDFEGS